MISVKRHGGVLAACDASLLGKKFEENELVLDIKKSFYGGQLIEEKELTELLLTATNINLVGEQTIRIAKKKGIVSQTGKIGGIPYAMIFKV